MAIRMTKAARRAAILNAAIRLAAEKGLPGVTRPNVAAYADVSTGLVGRYFGSMDALREEVIRDAVAREVVSVVAGALAVRHPIALAAGEDLIRRAYYHLTRRS